MVTSLIRKCEKMIEKHCFLHQNAASRKNEYLQRAKCSQVSSKNAAESFTVFHRKHQPYTERSVLPCFVK